MPKRTNQAVVLAVVAVVAVGVVVAVRWYAARRKQRRENLPIIPLIGLGISAAGALGVANKVPLPWNKKGPAVEPAYRGRYNDGIEWVCPDDTVETGGEDAKGCISSPYPPPVWKAGPDGVWAHLCPAGTAPTPETDWNKKCEVGWTSRVYSEDTKKWACPWGTWDSGKDWNKDTWHEAQKQCKRSKPYTTRILTNNKWTCPAGSKDTGKGWDLGKDQGWKQCKWTGP